jgi:cytochrome P450
VVLTFLLAMVLHPDVYKKAQEEMDRVVGPDRLPNLDDRKSLTYLDSVLKESYR